MVKRMITFKSKGDLRKTETFLNRCLELFDMGILNSYGRRGVEALSSATPVLTGRAANSWYYTINKNKYGFEITWCNSDIEGGCNVAVLLQYGHGTGTGGYVKGIDYINPAMKPIFEDMIEDFTRRV